MTQHPPLATYRLQLHTGFDFDAAAAVVPYLAKLGVSHVYCSPYLQAVAGSTHGYDVVDPSRVNAELGGDEGHGRFCAAVAEHGLGQILDIVPNHMAIPGRANAWWWDVLTHGRASRFAGHFDVDWDPPESKLRHTVLMPVLGDHYGRILEAGEIVLRFAPATAELTVTYHDHELPVAPPSADDLLVRAASRCRSDSLAFIGRSLSRLPHATLTDRTSIEQRHRDTEVLRAQLVRLCAEDEAVAPAIADVVAEVNADADRLDALLDRQNYRLAFWRTAGRELDYRRFFDINTLVGLRTEDPDVFADTHGLVLQWLAEGVLDGVRVDHPDGLLLPRTYFERLRRAAPDAWIVVEKVLEPGEVLPPWPVDGTTGYDALNLVGGLFVDRGAEEAMTERYARFTGETAGYHEALDEAKDQIMQDTLAADVDRLTNLAVRICEGHRRYRDYTRHDLRQAMLAVAGAFDVYRTYVDDEGDASPTDLRRLNGAFARAADRQPDLDDELLGFLRRILTAEVGGTDERELRLRFQQLTGPVMAKAAEDTTFYRYARLVTLNEVGSDPSRFGVPVAEFHAECSRLARDWPTTMTALSTHDTKRSEDVRARVATLAEVPAEWGEATSRWRAMNTRHRSGDWPDAPTEYLLYQTLVGAWPLSAERAVTYLEKATKEAKVHTSWVDPVPSYDDAIRTFAEAVLGDEGFVGDLEQFTAPLVAAGRVNALAQKLVALTMPGVPDLYQGTELWTLSLVDPDNRGPVDFAKRVRLLANLDAGGPGPAGSPDVSDDDAGTAKLRVVREALAARARHPGAFGAEGGYRPLEARGPAAHHVVAFARLDGEEAKVVTVVSRLPIGLATSGGWGDTVVVLPPGRFANRLASNRVAADATTNGGEVLLADLLDPFPVALLALEGP